MSDTTIRDRILEAAEECFAAFGVVETTMDDLVRATGVPRATLYRHVGNKEQVIVALSLRHLDETLVRIGEIMAAHDDLGDALVRTIDFVVETAQQQELVGAQLAPAARPNRLVRMTEATRDEVARRLVDFMGTALRPFRASGQVRPELTDTEAAAWLSVVIAGLVLAPDTIPADYREQLLRSMMLPAFGPGNRRGPPASTP